MTEFRSFSKRVLLPLWSSGKVKPTRTFWQRFDRFCDIARAKHCQRMAPMERHSRPKVSLQQVKVSMVTTRCGQIATITERTPMYHRNRLQKNISKPQSSQSLSIPTSHEKSSTYGNNALEPVSYHFPPSRRNPGVPANTLPGRRPRRPGD